MENKENAENKENHGESLPIGSEIDFEGQVADIPIGWEEVEDKGEIYSTTETRVGTWIDGKPLYRKVVDLGNLPNNAQKTVVANTSNLELCITCRGMAYNLTSGNFFPIPRGTTGGNFMIEYYKPDDVVAVRTTDDRTSFKGIAIIEYTKTTDVGGNE